MKNNAHKPHGLALLLIIGVFLGSYLSRGEYNFTKPFDPKLIDLYLRSQDIPDLPSDKERVFLSDSDIHIASGYLYTQGASPTDYNFQHPPLIKYLFGFSTRILGSPHFIQLGLALLLLFLTYLLGLRIFNLNFGATLAALLLAADPLLTRISQEALLDLGQSVLILSYLYFSLSKKPNSWLTGIFLGLISASKFWAGGLFFGGLINLYLLWQKKLNLKELFKQLLVAALVFNLTYFQTYWLSSFRFNNLFWQLKTLKYWFNHSVTSTPFASLFLFLTGFYQRWWGNGQIVFDRIWSPLWPLGLFASLRMAWVAFKTKPLSSEWLIVALIPLFYLLYLGIQAPFNRYFILILPYCYLALAGLMIDNKTNYEKSRFSHPLP